jgi:NAD+ diphosphatase
MSSQFTARLPLSRHRIDRDYLARERPALFEELWAEPATRVLVLRTTGALLRDDALALLPPGEVPEADLLLYLGRGLDDGTAYAAAVLTDAQAAVFGDDAEWGDLRSLGSTLDDLQAGLFTEAVALANWHATHRFSPRTGKPTVPALGGWVRRVEGEGHDLFPRTDAAIIVGVTDSQDRILLGSNAMWAANRYSLLAGFVEPGESLENAVMREVFEESGVRVKDPVYLGSQPWPFPASLMLGYRATVDETVESAMAPDGDEILEVRWFSRDELTAALGEIALPGPTSIARVILEDWYGGPIDDRTAW